MKIYFKEIWAGEYALYFGETKSPLTVYSPFRKCIKGWIWVWLFFAITIETDWYKSFSIRLLGIDLTWIKLKSQHSERG